jgi:hypothetical protein
MDPMTNGIIGRLLAPEIIWIAAMAALALSIVITTIFSFARRPGRRPEDMVSTVFVECASCRWTGEVPRLRKRCPVCGANNFTT